MTDKPTLAEGVAIRMAIRTRWAERAVAISLPLTGKKRDDAALNYVVGAVVALEAVGSPLVHALSPLVFLTSVRGACTLDLPEDN